MRLKVLGSGSSGNCFLLENKSECLVIEAGINFKEVLKAIDFNISKIVGCLVSHEHKDHSKYIRQFTQSGIKLYMSAGTAEELEIKSHYINTVPAGKAFKIGNYNVIAFKVQHDAAEPFGFYINHAETGNVLFATDTYYISNRFKDLNNILIECNYDKDILQKNIQNGIVSKDLKNRILESHMEIQTCIDCLKANDTRQVCNVVLIHLSGNNSNAENFKAKVQNIMSFSNVYIAEKGLDIEFNEYSF